MALIEAFDCTSMVSLTIFWRAILAETVKSRQKWPKYFYMDYFALEVE